MKLLVATDAHIFQSPDGTYWCKSIYGYDFWKRYLNVFDDVKIVARMKNVDELIGNHVRVDGPHVDVFGIPFYQGPKELLIKYIKIHKYLRRIDFDCDVSLLRLPSQTAFMVYSHLNKNKPVGGEIVYDIKDELNNSKQGLVMRILNTITSYKLKKFCLNANGVSYVTKNSIQKNYPSKSMLEGESKEYFSSYFSTITLEDSAFTGPRNYIGGNNLKIVLSSVSMNSERKGEKIVIEIIKKCRDRGYDVSAVLIGDGTLKKSFEEYAEELNVSEYVKFTGLLPSSDQVREVMLDLDVFVFPTMGEGLPRGILEAMAIGMPVLSTNVGGIPELIEEKFLFDPLDSEGFVNMICYLMDNRYELNKMSLKNYSKSLEFRNELLQARRDEFYDKLKNLAV